MTNDLIAFVSDYAKILIEMAEDAKKTSDNSEFSHGRSFAFHEALSLLQQQAFVFGYALKDMGIPDFVPEDFLILGAPKK